MQTLEYSPDLTARRLKLNTPCRIALIHPLPSQDQGFWAAADEGMDRAVREFAPFGVSIELVSFDKGHQESFEQAVRLVGERGFEGLLLAPLPPDGSRAALEGLKGVVVASFDIPFEHPALLLSLYQDGFSGGQAAAALCALHHQPTDALAVVGYQSPNPNIAQRIEGFCSGLTKAGFAPPAIVLIPDELDFLELRDYVASAGVDLSRYRGLFVAKTGAAKYARLLNGGGKRHFIVGYDIVRDNLVELRYGTLDALISQNGSHQVYEGLKALVNQLLYRQAPPRRRVRMPVDILLRENLQAYLEFHQIGLANESRGMKS
jgi:ABC-type sugar transport system substrate-binding protein